MVKIERTNGEKAKIAIISLEKERNKESGTYNTLDVFDALNEMFHGKCYLCEQRGSYQIEHLVPHKGDKNLEFNWNNLFLACPHCNNIKNWLGTVKEPSLLKIKGDVFLFESVNLLTMVVL